MTIFNKLKKTQNDNNKEEKEKEKYKQNNENLLINEIRKLNDKMDKLINLFTFFMEKENENEKNKL